MKVDVEFVIREFRRGEAETDPYDAIDTLVDEVDRLRRCVGDALFALEDPHGNLSDAHLDLVRSALAGALHPEPTRGAA